MFGVHPQTMATPSNMAVSMDKATFMLWMEEYFKSDAYVSTIKGICREITKEQQKIINTHTAEIKTRHSELSKLKQTVSEQTSIITELKQHSQLHEKVAKRNNIKIDGLAEDNEETPTNTVEKVSSFIKSNMHLDIKKGDILSAERLGIRKTDADKPRRILVQFSSVWKKKDVCRNRRLLKDITPKVYINEELTKENAAIYFQARQMVKTKELWSTYTIDGDIYVKKNKEEKKGKKIKELMELAYFTGQQSANETETEISDSSVSSASISVRQRMELSSSSTSTAQL